MIQHSSVFVQLSSLCSMFLYIIFGQEVAQLLVKRTQGHVWSPEHLREGGWGRFRGWERWLLFCSLNLTWELTASSSSDGDVLFRDCMHVAKNIHICKKTPHTFLKQDCWAQRNIPLTLTFRIKAGIKGQPGLQTELRDHLTLHNRTLSQNKMTKLGLWLLFQVT